MENVLLNGFDDINPASDDEKVPLRMQVKLADLGSGKEGIRETFICVRTCNNILIVMAPGRGEVTSITYRSPEVYFGKPWTSAIDIWAWGITVFLPTSLKNLRLFYIYFLTNILTEKVLPSSPSANRFQFTRYLRFSR